jgi:hypothetical protein
MSPRGLTLILGVAVLVAFGPVAAHAQATSRMCSDQAGEIPGPACLVGHEDIGVLPTGALYWNIYIFADPQSAARVKPPHAAVVKAFGAVWLFDVGGEGRTLEGGRLMSAVGPIPTEGAQGEVSVEYLKSTFTPGMTAPVHVHSGPEAFYAISGSSCLETPDGVQLGRGPGHSLMVRRGPPMLLMAIGQETRQGFAMILHGSGSPPTTLTPSWTPKGLCPKN